MSASDDRVASTLAKWRKTEQKASPAPWTVSEKHGMDIADEAWSEVKLTASDGSDVAALYISHLLENYNSDEDRAFITTARTAFPRLLAAVEAALKAADGWKYIHSSKCAQELREAIKTALTGQEASDGPGT